MLLAAGAADLLRSDLGRADRPVPRTRRRRGDECRRRAVHPFLEHGIDSRRVLKVEQVSACKVGSVVAVPSPLDVDEELSRWLRQAYQLGATAAERES
jgi:hypothetical protein